MFNSENLLLCSNFYDSTYDNWKQYFKYYSKFRFNKFNERKSKFFRKYTKIQKLFKCWKSFILGLLASGFCFSAWNKACKLVGTVKISFGIYLIPVVTIIFAFFTLHEKISFMGLLGAILTITGLFISNIKTSSKM